MLTVETYSLYESLEQSVSNIYLFLDKWAVRLQPGPGLGQRTWPMARMISLCRSMQLWSRGRLVAGKEKQLFLLLLGATISYGEGLFKMNRFMIKVCVLLLEILPV